MPGVWEQQANVLVGILHVDNVTMAWALGLRNLIIPGGILPVTGMPYDMSRNVICMRALEVGASHVFMLDSDVICPPDTILRLISHGQPFISGVYSRRSPPHAVPVMLKNGQWITKYPRNRVIEVDLVGSGCLLIRRDFLERIPPQRAGHHWFSWQVDMKGTLPENECLSEDFTLCRHAQKHGYKVLVDTGIQCKHIGYAQATHGSFVPLETIP